MGSRDRITLWHFRINDARHAFGFRSTSTVSFSAWVSCAHACDPVSFTGRVTRGSRKRTRVLQLLKCTCPLPEYILALDNTNRNYELLRDRSCDAKAVDEYYAPVPGETENKGERETRPTKSLELVQRGEIMDGHSTCPTLVFEELAFHKIFKSTGRRPLCRV